MDKPTPPFFSIRQHNEEVRAFGERMAAWGAAMEQARVKSILHTMHEESAARHSYYLVTHNRIAADSPGRDKEIEALRAELAACKEDAERYRKGHERYETARLLHPQQWKEAWLLNRNTGKPFDEIIDDLRTFGSDAIDKARGS